MNEPEFTFKVPRSMVYAILAGVRKLTIEQGEGVYATLMQQAEQNELALRQGPPAAGDVKVE